MEEGKEIRGINPNIPHHIVEEIILVKLPVKSLMRFKAVSREWRGAVESKCFEEKHMRYQKSLEVGGQARFVAIPIGETGHMLSLQNLLLSSNGILQYTSPYPPVSSFLRVFGFHISPSCDGLFCFYTHTRIFHLVNPATTSHRVLPDPISDVSGDARRSLVGIGRENSASPRYKLVCYFNHNNKLVNKSTRCKVFALASKSNTWRYVDNPPDGILLYDHPMMHLDGVIYSLSYCLGNNRFEQDHKLIAFDLHTETFQSFPITLDIGNIYINDLTICVLNHRICIFKVYVGKDDLFYNIWGLDINKRSWKIMHSIDVSCIPLEVKAGKINQIATINNYLILCSCRNFWGHSASKNKDFLIHRTFQCHSLMPYVETLVSAYQ